MIAHRDSVSSALHLHPMTPSPTAQMHLILARAQGVRSPCHVPGVLVKCIRGERVSIFSSPLSWKAKMVHPLPTLFENKFVMNSSN